MIIHVLGTAQDGGYPHAGCNKACCSSIWQKPELHRLPSSIAAIDLKQKQFYLFDITPNVKEQLYYLNQYNCQLAGIFITHAHIGHYLGLMDLGLEVMNTQNIPVYVMPRMKNFILNNQPMLQLVENNNIELIQINNNQNILFITDGQLHEALSPDHTVLITKSNFEIGLIDFNDSDYFQTLRTKMGWGTRGDGNR